VNTETPAQEFHRLAGHDGPAAGCPVCTQVEARQAEASRRARAAARRRTRALTAQLDRHRRAAR
jgi:hypothetical protein